MQVEEKPQPAFWLCRSVRKWRCATNSSRARTHPAIIQESSPRVQKWNLIHRRVNWRGRTDLTQGPGVWHIHPEVSLRLSATQPSPSLGNALIKVSIKKHCGEKVKGDEWSEKSLLAGGALCFHPILFFIFTNAIWWTQSDTIWSLHGIYLLSRLVPCVAPPPPRDKCFKM